MLILLHKGVPKKNLNFSDWRSFSFTTGVDDTGGAPWAANISTNFRKNSKQCAEGNWFIKKLEVENLLVLIMEVYTQWTCSVDTHTQLHSHPHPTFWLYSPLNWCMDWWSHWESFVLLVPKMPNNPPLATIICHWHLLHFYCILSNLLYGKSLIFQTKYKSRACRPGMACRK
jgi:hypothetical protein